jgi:hypothetical protein
VRETGTKNEEAIDNWKAEMKKKRKRKGRSKEGTMERLLK